MTPSIPVYPQREGFHYEIDIPVGEDEDKVKMVKKI